MEFLFVSEQNLLVPAMQLFGSEDRELQSAMNMMQKELQCCGSDRYDEWFEHMWMPAYNLLTGVEIGFPESDLKSVV